MMTMLVEISKVDNQGTEQRFEVRNVSINPDHVIRLSADTRFRDANKNNTLGVTLKDLDKRAEFTRIVMRDNVSMVVIGSISSIEEKLSKGKNKSIIHG